MFPRVEQPVNSKIAMCPGAEEAPSASRKHREIYLFFKQLRQVLKYHRSWHETKILTAIKVTRIEPLDLLRNICNKCFIVVDCVMFCGFFVCVFGFWCFFDVGWLIIYGVAIVLLGVIQFRKKMQQIASHGIGSNLLSEKPAFRKRCKPWASTNSSGKKKCSFYEWIMQIFSLCFPGFLAADSQSWKNTTFFQYVSFWGFIISH